MKGSEIILLMFFLLKASLQFVVTIVSFCVYSFFFKDVRLLEKETTVKLNALWITASLSYLQY